MDKSELEKKQKELDAEFINQGITEELIDKQIALNKLRNEHDINIDKELNDEGFAQ